MHKLIGRFHSDERRATAIEPSSPLFLIALAIAFGAQTLGQGINSLFSQIGTQLSNIPLPKI